MVWTVIIKECDNIGFSVEKICGPLCTEDVIAKIGKSKRKSIIALIRGDHAVWDASSYMWKSSKKAMTNSQGHDLYIINRDDYASDAMG
jgi:hypothetical protein